MSRRTNSKCYLPKKKKNPLDTQWKCSLRVKMIILQKKKKKVMWVVKKKKENQIVF